MDCSVVVEAAVPVYDVETEEEAVRIAISKTGEMLNPDLNYVEIEMGERTSPSGEELPPAFIAADEALVALELEMTVFNVERDEHASRIARKEIGQRLQNIPLKVLSVERIEDDDEDEEEEVQSEADEGGGAEAVDEAEEAAPLADADSGEELVDELAGDDAGDAGDGDGDEDDEDLIPEFEDMVEE